MKFSILTVGGNLLPAVWPSNSETEEGLLAEAKEMRMSQLHLHPALVINWDEKSVKRLSVSISPDREPKIFDNAGEIFGIATSLENFEDIAEKAKRAKEQS